MLSSRFINLVAPKFTQLLRANFNTINTRHIVVLGLSNVRNMVTRVDQTKTTVTIPVEVVKNTRKTKVPVEGSETKKARKSPKSTIETAENSDSEPKSKSTLEKPEKIKKEKKVKKPKRPLTAFNLFGQDERSKVIALNPSAKFGEIQVVLAARWKALPSAEKDPYIRKSDFLKAAAPPKYMHSKLDSLTTDKALLLNPYMLFSTEERIKLKEQHPNLKLVEISKLIGQKWKAISAAQKEAFNALYMKQKEVLDQFNTIDQDKNGYITFSELPTSIPEDTRQKMMKMADRDGDGKITKGEYFHTMMPSSFLNKYKSKSL